MPIALLVRPATEDRTQLKVVPNIREPAEQEDASTLLHEYAIFFVAFGSNA